MMEVVNEFMSWLGGGIWSSHYAKLVFHSTREQGLYFHSYLISLLSFPLLFLHQSWALCEGWRLLEKLMFSSSEYACVIDSVPTELSKSIPFIAEESWQSATTLMKVLWHLWVTRHADLLLFCVFLVFSHIVCACFWLSVCEPSARPIITFQYTSPFSSNIPYYLVALQGSSKALCSTCVCVFFSACKS